MITIDFTFPLASLRSKCTTPPAASEIHISFPAGGMSTLESKAPPSAVYISRETPDSKDKERSVQS